MKIVSELPKYAKKGVSKLGQALLDPKKQGSAVSRGLHKVNDFVQGEGINPGRGAYYTLISAFVLGPRLLNAREPDEFREIATRDIITILTILFAMKGLKSGMCMQAQKKSGLVLVKDTVGKSASLMKPRAEMSGKDKKDAVKHLAKRLLGYLKAEGGIYAIDSNEILARYSNKTTQESLVNMLEMIDKEGGNLSKMFCIEKNKGIMDALKQKIPYFKNRAPKECPLFDAAEKMFGKGFETKNNKELIDIVKSITPSSPIQQEGLSAIIGEHALDIVEGGESALSKGILNDSSNPLTYFARDVASKFETLSLGLVASFLGFGLPKINERLTLKKYDNTPDVNSQYMQEYLMGEQKQIYNYIDKLGEFQSFTGK